MSLSYVQQKLWTEEEDKILQENIDKLSYRQIGEILNRSNESIRKRVKRLGGREKSEPLQLIYPEPNYPVREAPKQPRVLLKAAVFDLETTSFGTSGWSGHLICCCVLPLDGKEPQTYTIRFRDLRDDKRVLREVVETLEQYEILIGHNIAAFDMGWLFSRLVHHYLPTPEKSWFYYDTYFAAKRMAIKAERKSLAFLCDYFRVPCEKTAVYPTSWSKIDSPDELEFDEALRDITYHCQRDVEANRNLFDVLWPLDHSLVNLPRIKKW